VPLGEEADAKLLIGDAALKSAFEDPTRTTTSGACGSSGRVCRWSSRSAPRPSRSRRDARSSRTRWSPRCAGAGGAEQLAYEASERYGYPAGFLARYFEKLRYRFGPRERAGLFTFLEMARDVGELARCRSSGSCTTRCRGMSSAQPELVASRVIERYPSPSRPEAV
jgi:predicted solute-binding protein